MNGMQTSVDVRKLLTNYTKDNEEVRQWRRAAYKQAQEGDVGSIDDSVDRYLANRDLINQLFRDEPLGDCTPGQPGDQRGIVSNLKALLERLTQAEQQQEEEERAEGPTTSEQDKSSAAVSSAAASIAEYEQYGLGQLHYHQALTSGSEILDCHRVILPDGSIPEPPDEKPISL